MVNFPCFGGHLGGPVFAGHLVIVTHRALITHHLLAPSFVLDDSRVLLRGFQTPFMAHHCLDGWLGHGHDQAELRSYDLSSILHQK